MAIARLFIAVDIGPSLKEELQACARDLRPAFPDARWVRPEAMHVTLHFLGDTPLERLDAVDGAVAAVTGVTAPFTGEVTGLGVFPTPERPSVVWAGIGPGRDDLTRLATRLGASLAEAGFETDRRPYSAHITIARIRQGRSRPRERAQEALTRWAGHRFGCFAVDRVTVYASTLTPSGPRYEPLRSRTLTEGPS